MSREKVTANAFADHNHQTCFGDVMNFVDKLEITSGLRLTPVRRRVLEILLEEHKALGAYQILEKLAECGFGNQPPVAYRALEYLVKHGLAHRIRRLNAFMACMQPGMPHSPTFLICGDCDAVAEVPELTVSSAVYTAANDFGFKIERMTVEAIGTCPNCLSEG